ncbi:MAG TPA: tetratricopeptide repeat protein [Bryobacteraceae bacterium]|jgi:tetratricopeptide (TPR) repeat protein|nr:tetratricopeptide repeat protein [Bryobacteraceae bacterium]
MALFAMIAPVQAQNAPKKVDKAAAYYYYSLGHLYSELAGAYGNRGEYLNKAIENYKLAMKADPSATFLGEELSDLYIQAGRLREAVNEAEEALKANPKDVSARRLLGRIYTRMIGDSQQGRIDEGMMKKAIEQYEKVVELEPDDIDTLVMLGRLQKIAGNSVESEKAYKKVLAIDADNEDALTGLAMVYSDLGNTKAATELLQRLTQKSPSLRTLTALATSYEQMRDYSMAAETLRRTLQLAPNNIEVKRAYALNLMLSDQLEEAIKVYDEIVASDPRDFQAHLRLSQIYRQQRKFDKAREASDRAKAIEGDNLEVRYNEVNLLDAEGKIPEAIAALKEVIVGTSRRNYTQSEKANRVMLLERLAILFRTNDQYPESVQTFKQILEVDPSMGARVAAQVVDTYRIGKDLKKAAAEADLAIAKYPDDRLLRAVRANVLAEVGRSDEATTELKKLLDGKNDRETYISLAQVYEKTKNYGEMAKSLDAAEKLSNSKDEKEAIAFMRGAMYEKQKKYDLAETEFRKVLSANPNNASALNYLGYMLADRGVRLQEARDLVTKALDNDPTNGAYLDSLGWVYYRLDDLEQAEHYLRMAMERYSKDPTVHDHMGDVLFKRGRLKEAVAQWQISLNEWQNAAPSEQDSAEVGKIQKKLDSAKVRLAKEGSPNTKEDR